MVGGTAYRTYMNFIFARDPAEISMEPFPDLVPNKGSSLGGREYDVDQATYVTMRHGFSRPFGTSPVGCESIQELTIMTVIEPDPQYQLLAAPRFRELSDRPVPCGPKSHDKSGTEVVNQMAPLLYPGRDPGGML